MHFYTNMPHELTLFRVNKVVTKTTACSHCQEYTAFNGVEFGLRQNTFSQTKDKFWEES